MRPDNPNRSDLGTMNSQLSRGRDRCIIRTVEGADETLLAPQGCLVGASGRAGAAGEISKFIRNIILYLNASGENAIQGMYTSRSRSYWRTGPGCLSFAIFSDLRKSDP